jgi:hypothetical protein
VIVTFNTFKKKNSQGKKEKQKERHTKMAIILTEKQQQEVLSKSSLSSVCSGAVFIYAFLPFFCCHNLTYSLSIESDIIMTKENSNKTILSSPLYVHTNNPSKKEAASPKSRQKLRQFWQRACQDELYKNHQTTLSEAIQMGICKNNINTNNKEAKIQQVQKEREGQEHHQVRLEEEQETLMEIPGESLGKLIIEMRETLKQEISKRNEVEKRNFELLIEMEQLKKDFIHVKSNNRLQERIEEETLHQESSLLDIAKQKGESADFWWKEMQKAKKEKENALNQVHEKNLQIMELNACISMQHDELKALRIQENDGRFHLLNAEDRLKEISQQNTLLNQENKLLKEDVQLLNHEIGKRSTHFKNLLDKWTNTQAQCEHFAKENQIFIDKIKDLRLQNEHFIAANEALRDEKNCLQHQVHHLKGSIAAKTVESKAFQAYTTNARDYLQNQHAIIQKNQIYRRKIHKVAKETVLSLRSMKKNLQIIRAPLVAIQKDFFYFLKNLKIPVLTLVTKSQMFVQIAQAEHFPLRNAFLTSENARKHLHDQLWKAKRNAFMICQVRNDFIPQESTQHSLSSSPSQATTLPLENTLIENGPMSSTNSPPPLTTTTTTVTTTMTLSANYSTGDIFLKQKETDTTPTVVKFDKVVSDRHTPSNKWNPQETIAPFLQSILDGYNGIVTTFEGLPSLRVNSSGTSTMEITVATLLLRSLFDMVSKCFREFHRLRFTFSYLAIYKEIVYDLLVVPGTSNESNQDQNIVVLEIQNAEEAELALKGGLENINQAQRNGILDPECAHQVLTVCISNENLLSGELTKSKLQIVQLAVGGEETLHGLPKDPEKIKALVSLENGIHALTSSLAEARFKEPAFVRYYSSKLTVLLQDCIKCTSKFLLVMGVSSSSLTKQLALETSPELVLSSKTNKILRAVQNFRNALYYSSSSASWEHKQPCSDRSFGGFMNRFTESNKNTNKDDKILVSNQSPLASEEIWNNNIPLTFPIEVVRRVSREDLKWDKELQNMQKRKKHFELIEKQNTIQSMTNFFVPTFYESSRPEQEQEQKQEEENIMKNNQIDYDPIVKEQQQQISNRKKKNTTKMHGGSYSAFGRTIGVIRNGARRRDNTPMVQTQTHRPHSTSLLRRETASSALKRQIFVKTTKTSPPTTTIPRKKRYIPFR